MRITFTAYDAMMPLSEMKESKHQRNIHPKEQIERLAKNMRELGVQHPIHISKRSGEIAFGHGRKLSALLNEWTEYPVVYQDFVSDEEEYISVQADNGLSEWSHIDLAKINKDLEIVGPFDVDLLGIQNFVMDMSEKADLDEKANKESRDSSHVLEVHFSNEAEMIEVYDDLLSRGLIVKCK